MVDCPSKIYALRRTIESFTLECGDGNDGEKSIPSTHLVYGGRNSINEHWTVAYVDALDIQDA